ncbi:MULTISPECIES: response regulator transcription factor [Streptococcus]|uniref:DNA-binding response regulator n=1 Tax=Streptococcus ruminantium TaxID=1917441 RepID=A0A2Z5TS70_9STRE|nr:MULTISPECIES: winged helix-turn-helix domain-containing protein [Streptococcus]MDQ8779897.1 winged helix-turn-helix domain-containing protein [Streptococcus ruminantium]MDQ8820450.1 winged helix-turn-helix domain-containing protein [Streptococcus ruminantium]QHF55206.1 DNA-binding response regulator [Streptococcus sp. DAT741]BBA93165.1 DNA-binding response regulator [Streptococcus ruminantium]BDD39303.1 two-component system response regulator [Streptococcus ruminantium]
MAKKILIAGKERNLSHFVSMELQKKDYLVDYVSTGKEALSLAHETDFDLILMSFQLSDMSSKELAKELLAMKPATVMIVAMDPADVSQHGEEVLAYAVSYVVKPFVISDLVEQISAIFRGRDFIDNHCKQVHLHAAYRDLKVDFQNRTVTRGDELINLTRREYDLLATLMNSPEAVSREQLLERVWKYEAASETNVVDVYIRYLRGKLDLPNQESYIKTVRGVGYAMRD